MPLLHPSAVRRARRDRSPLTRRLVVAATSALVAAGLVAAALSTTATAEAATTTSSATSSSAGSSASKAWGGYSNGSIPLTALTSIPGGYLRPDAATAYTALAAAFTATFHEPLTVVEGYRSLDSQTAIFQSRFTVSATPTPISWNGQYWTQNAGAAIAAVPGTSVHGWALAMDLGSNVQIASSPEKAWVDANGPAFGWYPVGNDFGEPWHFEFTPTGTSAYPTTASTTPVATGPGGAVVVGGATAPSAIFVAPATASTGAADESAPPVTTGLDADAFRPAADSDPTPGILALPYAPDGLRVGAASIVDRTNG
ncbi:M15 family metallopeptidase [Frondihabitans cladoniiphilus]|uniref:D-alanyl-D-alanine carboxypeptidase-like core domain-containing protein n=1 Tax=Frondihabitans cladoniiphilus TaxID=715785 RepID=A0ABP8VW96_9MICO